MQDSPRPSNAEAPLSAPPILPPTTTPAARPYGLIGLTIGFVLIVVAAMLFCIVVLVGAFVVAALIFGRPALDRLSHLRDAAFGGDEAILQAAGVALSLLFYAAVAASVLAAARLRGGANWRDVIGWHPWDPFRRSLLFWAVAIGAIGYNVAVDTAITYLYPPSKTWITVPQQPLWAALFVGLAVLFAPVAEELLFRGWLYTGLRAKIGIWAANIVSAAVFALAHWESTHIYALAVFPVGLALGFIRERSDSLKASIAFHAVYNAAASAFLVFSP